MYDDDAVKQKFAERLKGLREAAGLSQAELAEQLGVSRGSISFYENCDRVPDIVFLNRASEFFAVGTNFLLGGTENLNPANEEIGTFLGLSDKAISNISESDFQEALSAIIEHEEFENLMCLIWWGYLPSYPGVKRHTDIDYWSYKVSQVFMGILIDLSINKSLGTWATSVLCNFVSNGESEQAEDIKQSLESIKKERLDNLASEIRTLKEEARKVKSDLDSRLKSFAESDEEQARKQRQKKIYEYVKQISDQAKWDGVTNTD